jgi:ribose transport system substrate-binding protein
MGAILGGQGNVLVVRHMPRSHSTAKRVAGFTQTIEKEFPGIRIVDSQSGQDTVETARQVTVEMLRRHSDVQGLFACNITTSVGALQALRELQRSQVKMVAFDPDKALVEGLRQGQIAAIILQNPYQMGYEGVKAVALTYKRQPRVIDTGLQILTTETLNDPNMKRLVDLQE